MVPAGPCTEPNLRYPQISMPGAQAQRGARGPAKRVEGAQLKTEAKSPEQIVTEGQWGCKRQLASCSARPKSRCISITLLPVGQSEGRAQGHGYRYLAGWPQPSCAPHSLCSVG